MGSDREVRFAFATQALSRADKHGWVAIGKSATPSLPRLSAWLTSKGG